MREQLLGYLLDALDDAERVDVEQLIENDPAWREELRVVQDALEPLAEAGEPYAPPPHLAERTCAMVHSVREAERATPVRRRWFSGLTDTGAAGSRWSVADTMVTAGILLVAAMLFFPAIANSRYAARAAQCQNNLRQLGMALASYSDKAGAGYFPWVPSFGNRAFAGIYAPVLYDAGYMTEPSCLTCPAANREPVATRVPTLVEIDQATPRQLPSIRRVASRDYGYNLGVVVNGQHRAIRNRCRERFALMADSPGTPRIRDRGIDHLGQVRNILWEDGHVEAVKVDLIDKVWNDHPFQNDYGFTEAGIDGEDAVVADGATPPFGQSGILPELK